MTAFDAVILAGGAGRRLGCVDKALLEVGGRSLLERVISAVSVAGAKQIVCVGPVRATTVPVTWCREDPPGGGPVAGLAAGLRAAGADIVVVLAVDLPFVTSATVSTLLAAMAEHDGAAAVDASGRLQPLLAVYRRSALEGQLRTIGSPAGARVRDLVAGLSLREVPAHAAAEDCDTGEALEAARVRSGD